MGSYAFKCVVWFFCAALMGSGLFVVAFNMSGVGWGDYTDYRAQLLLTIGTPVMLGIVPVITMFALPFSRRLR